MKTSKIILFIGLIISVGLTPACKKSVVNPAAPETLPDASFSAAISGASSQQINASMPNQSSSTSAATGGYTSVDNLLNYTFLASDSKKSNAQTQISFQSSSESLSTGTYKANERVYLDVENSTSFGKFISGKVTVTKKDLYRNFVAGAAIYWVNCSAQLVLEYASNLGSTITVSFQFTNINTVEA